MKFHQRGLRARPLQAEESLGAMKKTNLTRTLLAACSIVALTAVMYGCVHSDDDPPPTDPPPMDDDDGDGDGDDGDGDDGDGDDGDGDDGDGDPPATEPPPMDDDDGDGDREANPMTGHLIAGAIGNGMAGDANNNDAGAWLDVDGTADGDQVAFTSDGRMFTTTHSIGLVAGTQVPVPDDEMFAASMDSPIEIDGWQGTMHTRMQADDDMTMDTNESITDTVVSYTNEMDGTDEVWATFFAATTQTGVDNATVGGTTGEIELAEDQSMNHMNVDADFGLNSNDQNITIPVDNPDTTEIMETAATFMGSFYGVPGTYSCTGTCGATSDGDGNLMNLNGTWTFTADRGGWHDAQ